MRRRLFILAILLCTALLQQVLRPWAAFGGMKPPILASVALHFALQRNNEGWRLAVFGAAILHDALDIGSFGPALLSFPVLCYFAHRFRNEIFTDGIVTQCILGAGLGLFTCLTALLLYTITGRRPFSFGLSLLRLTGSFMLGLAAFPLISRALSRLEKALPKRRSYGWQ